MIAEEIDVDDATLSWLRNPSDELAVANGCRFDHERGQFVCDWIERHCHLYEGSRELMKLLEWEREATMRLFGWVKWSPRLRRWIRRFTRATIFIPKKNGKALALDTPVPTPNGWATIGELRVGDMIFSADGTPCEVTKAHPIHTADDCYKVTFSNGEQIKCNGEHLWQTTALNRQIGGHGKGKIGGGNKWTGSPGTRWNPTAVRSTTEILATLKRLDGACNHSVDLQRPIVTAESNLPIDPYVFGCWLGDGDSDSARITCDKKDFPSYQKEFFQAGYSIPHCNCGKSNVYRFRFQRINGAPEVSVLKRIGVFKNKHIPAVYLRASICQRLDLLCGLMDTDGTVDKSGKCITYSTKLDSLKDGVCELLASLGVKFRVRASRPVISGRQRCYYSVQFHAFADILNVFRLPRKVKRLRKTSELKMRARSRTIQIKNIERIEPVTVRCITVKHPSGLFLCGRSMIPTHNSPYLASIALYLLAGDGEQGNHVFFAAADGGQARIAAKHAVEMVRTSAELDQDQGGDIRINLNEMKLTHMPSLSDSKPISSGDKRAAQAKQGLNGSVLVDEAHVISHSFLSESSLERAGASREEPIFLTVSTAGKDPDSWGRSQYDYGKSVESGETEDQAFFFLCYEAPHDLSDGDLDANPSRWGQLANPTWGTIIQEDEFLADYNRSKRSLADLADFKTFRLNIWQQSESPWLRAGDWKACQRHFTESDLLGRTCCAGLDLSKIYDMTAIVLCFKDGDRYQILPYFFLPEAGVKRLAVLFPQVLDWVAKGFIIQTEGDVIDFTPEGPFFKTFIDLSQKFSIEKLLFDPHQAEAITQQLSDITGVVREQFAQTITMFNEPTQDFERDVIRGALGHNGNPCMTWQIGHCKVKTDVNANKRPVKPAPNDPKKIDGVVAGIMARAGAGNIVEWYTPGQGM